MEKRVWKSLVLLFVVAVAVAWFSPQDGEVFKTSVKVAALAAATCTCWRVLPSSFWDYL